MNKWQRNGIVAAAILCLSTGAFSRFMLKRNEDESMPQGIYVRSFDPIVVGDVVWFRVPGNMMEYMKGPYPYWYRHFSRSTNGFLKPVVAKSGDTICRDSHNVVSVNGSELGIARTKDGINNDLPMWSGCIRLNGQYAVFSDYGDPSENVDSRIFGPIDAKYAVHYKPLVLF